MESKVDVNYSAFMITNYYTWAGVLVKWLWEETHLLKVVGSNPGTVYWMDIFHIYLL